MRRGDVQGLRAAAILSVVAYHARVGLSGGFTGVDVFFVISGFVITGTLVRELERSATISIRNFYARRVKRLLPALAAMLTFVALAGMLLAPVAAVQMSADTGISASFFAANWYLNGLTGGYFLPSTNLDPLLHTWSLGVEEQFYLVFPVLLLAVWKVSRPRSDARVWAALVVVAGAVVSLYLSASWFGGDDILAFYASPARAWEFAVGCVISLLLPVWQRLPALVCSALATVGVVAIIVGAASAASNGSPLDNVIMPVVGTALLLVAGTRVNIVSRLFATRPAVWIGDRSYSWYLWHWPLIVFSAAVFPGRRWVFVTAAVGSLLVADTSYRLLENPIRFNPHIVGKRLLALAVACIVLPIYAAGAEMHIHLESAYGAYGAGLHVDRARGCDSAETTNRKLCRWPIARPHGVIVLIGDSNAGHFTEPVIAAAHELRFNVTVATRVGCPFVSLLISTPYENDSSCVHSNRLAMRWLLRTRPNLVIIGTRSDAHIDSDEGFQIANGPVVHDINKKQVYWAKSLRSELAALSEVGVPTIVVHPVPVATIDPRGCAVVLLLASGCQGTTSRRTVDRELEPTLLAERAAIKGIPGASLLDLESELCGMTECRTRVRGIDLYADPTHLSVAGALTLTRTFSAAIKSHARRVDKPAGAAASA